jgi:geranylgeranylglycerol-phosphate geranylgeranyltransferase
MDTDSTIAAKLASLNISDRSEPGISRLKIETQSDEEGSLPIITYEYKLTDGKKLVDERRISLLNSLVVPPAWTDVWFCNDEKGHIQATGKDAKGRLQYRYHPDWNAIKSDIKFANVDDFAMMQSAWRLIRGPNALVGASTVAVGALMVRVDLTGIEWIIVGLHAFCVATFMGAWNAFNDIFDAESDAINHPERPIPSGALTEYQAKAIARFCFLLSIVALLTAMVVTARWTDGLEAWLPSIGIWFLAFLLMFHYEMVVPQSFSLKHKGLAGNLSVSLLVGIVIVFGAGAVGGVLTPLVWFVAAVAAMVNAAREIVKDIEDEEGDADRETLTKQVGAETARGYAQILILMSLLPLVFPYARGLLPMGLMLTQLPAMLALVSVKPRLYRGEDYGAQRTLRLAMMLGLAGFLASVLIPLVQ